MQKFDSIEQAVQSIQKGELVIVLDDEDRENEGDLIMAAEKITPNHVNFMATEGRGLICTPLSEKIAKKFDLAPMVEENKESYKCNFTVSVDYKHGTSTGISASDRAKTILKLSEDSSIAKDFARPGHVFPLIAKDGGVLVRAGHTEAAMDLVLLAGLKPVGVLCEIARKDGEMMRRDELFDFAKKHSLKIITISDLIEFRRKSEVLVDLVAETKLNTKYGDFQLKIFKSKIDDKEHIALCKGDIDGEDDILVRVHSECITSEIFSSLSCDCRDQLEIALQRISNENKGIFLYMRQEGRGIGLVNKIKAYELQKKGLDTVEANEKLGFAPDLREYGIGAQILHFLGVRKVKLMTNNPTKIVGLEGYGLKITARIPIEVKTTERNRRYLKTKRDRMGHIFKNL